MLKYVTGVEYSENELLNIGKRIYTLERDFNINAGFTKDDDTLPPRFLNEKLEEGASRNKVVKLDEMLLDYYKIRGWDEEGKPDKELLNELEV